MYQVGINKGIVGIVGNAYVSFALLFKEQICITVIDQNFSFQAFKAVDVGVTNLVILK